MSTRSTRWQGRACSPLRAFARAFAHARARACRPLALLGLAIGLPASASAQADAPSLIQIEVGDSIGLPLTDAKVEMFALLEGGIVWEWTVVDASALPPGTSLLRFSYPGYRTAVFSVPLRKGSRVALRVRLVPERDTTGRTRAIQAHEVRAIGMALEGRVRTNIIGMRRVLDRAAIDAVDASTFGALLHRARATELNVVPGFGGTYKVLSGSSGASTCPVQVMVNGDRRQTLPFATFDQMFSPRETEAIEIFPRATSLPLAYQVRGSGCGMLVVWFRNP